MPAYAIGGSHFGIPAVLDAPDVEEMARHDPAPQRCIVCTIDGRHVTGGFATVTDAPGPYRVCVTELTSPGVLLNAYIGRGVRWFALALENGQVLLAELNRTSWRAHRGRLCCFSVWPAAAGHAGSQGERAAAG